MASIKLHLIAVQFFKTWTWFGGWGGYYDSIITIGHRMTNVWICKIRKIIVFKLTEEIITTDLKMKVILKHHKTIYVWIKKFIYYFTFICYLFYLYCISLICFSNSRWNKFFSYFEDFNLKMHWKYQQIFKNLA